MKRENCELWIKNFLPILATIVKLKKYPAKTEDNQYIVLTFKSRGRGAGKGGRNMLPENLIPIRRKFLIALKKAPDIGEQIYGIKYIDEGRKKILLIRKDIIDRYSPLPT